MQFLSQEYFSIRHSFQVVYLFLATRLIYGSFLTKYATRQSMNRRLLELRDYEYPLSIRLANEVEPMARAPGFCNRLQVVLQKEAI